MRYERKYRIEQVDKQLILQTLKLHPAGLKVLFPDRQINNIYFDTPSLTTYKENVMGIANRDKFRVRWYGWDVKDIHKPKLEIKHRRNNVGYKTIHKIETFELNALQPLTQQVNNLIPSFAVLKPVLQNSYKRSYFSTRDQKFRLTLDWDLTYFSFLNNYEFKQHQRTELNTCILEVKYEKELEDQVDRIAQFLPFRSTKNSKYVSGVQLCH